MKKVSKFLYCATLTALIFCACIVPCFAIEVTVEAEGWNNVGYSPNISESAPTNIVNATEDGYFSIVLTEVLIELAEELYTSNAFNGSRPVLITLSRNNSGYEVLFWCNGSNLNLVSYNDIYVVKNENTADNTLNFTLPSSYNYRFVSAYTLQRNGSVKKASYPAINNVKLLTTYVSDSIGSTNGPHASWYYAYYDGREWVYDQNDRFCTCSNVGAEEYGMAIDEFTYALDQWKNANKGTTYVETAEYQLDISAIITAIPNGAKQIINNAFGFELFGINVAGLLTAIIVITLVAFFVKWLMSR